MEQYRYRLEAKGNQHVCPNPQCGKKTFSRYVDTLTNRYLHDSVGLCNRRDKCGYHLPPREFFKNNPDQRPDQSFNVPQRIDNVPHEVSVGTPIDPLLCRKTLSNYPRNNFVQFLRRLYRDETVQKLVGIYSIGTAKNNRTIFWQIDCNDKIRRGKIILYNSESGKRDKESNSTSSVHHELRIQAAQMPQCFFGEHLLTKFPNKPVAIFESEKTAIIAAAYFTDFICLASGGKTGLNEAKCQVLKGREVYLFPDLNAYDLWKQKALEYRHVVTLTVSDLLEKRATEQERLEGLDVADYLIKFLLSNKNKTNILNGFTQPTQLTPHLAPQPLPEKKEGSSESVYIQQDTVLTTQPLQSLGKQEQNQAAGASLDAVFSPLYDRLRFSPIGKIQFLMECPEFKKANINLYLFYRLITAWNQDKLAELFSTNEYYPKEVFMDKLPDRWEFQELKTDGFSLLKEHSYSVFLFYQAWNPKHFKHNGLLYYSFYEEDFENKDDFAEAVNKVKSLQNVILVYSTGANRIPFLNFMVYCGELPNISRLSKDDPQYTCLNGYDERWMKYRNYLKQHIGLNEGHRRNPNVSLSLDIDLEAWFNPDLENLLNWNQLVKKYEL